MENKETPFHIKYRPDNFKDITGNEEIVESLLNWKKDKNRPHVLLFTGNSGCGKTTFGRIIQKELDCHKNDFVEVNSSSDRGIDKIRDMVSNINFSPMSGNTKIYLLDECHKLTNEAQNALLKPLEDTPKHVYFILCTTNPEKLLKALRNRCTEFQVESLLPRDLISLMKGILEKEGLEINIQALKKIAKKSEGSARKSLVLLQSMKDLSEEQIEKHLEKINNEEAQVIDLCRLLIKKKVKWEEITSIIKNIKDLEPENVRHAVLGYCSSVILSGVNVEAAIVIEKFKSNFYDSGKAGLIFACFEVFSEKE